MSKLRRKKFSESSTKKKFQTTSKSDLQSTSLDLDSTDQSTERENLRKISAVTSPTKLDQHSPRKISNSILDSRNFSTVPNSLHSYEQVHGRGHDSHHDDGHRHFHGHGHGFHLGLHHKHSHSNSHGDTPKHHAIHGHSRISGDTPLTRAMLRRLPSRVSQTVDLEALFEDDSRSDECTTPTFHLGTPDDTCERRASIGIVDYEIRNERSSMVASLILLYGLSMILCSAVLPISDAFVDDRSTEEIEHSIALPIFHLSQYAISITSLIYMMAIIKHYTHRKQKLLGIDNRKSLKKGRKLLCCKKERSVTDDDEDIDEIQNQFDGKADGETLSDNTMKSPNNINANDSQVHFINSGASTISNHSDPEKDQNQAHSTFETSTMLVGEISQMSEGVNLYLRLGAVGFGFGVMVHDGFKISDQWSLNGHRCSRSDLWIPEILAHFVYVFIQTYFLLKYHRIVFNCQKPCVRFCLTHLAVTNLGQWLKAVVFEITEDLRMNLGNGTGHGQKHPNHSNYIYTSTDAYHLNVTLDLHSHGDGKDSHEGAQHGQFIDCKKHFSDKISPFLYPCAIEYSLISAAIFFKIFQKVGHMFREGRKYRISRSNEPDGPLSGCHRSHRGLFVGLLVFMATLVSIALFFVFSKKVSEDLANYIYQATEITLLCSTICASFAALLQFRKLDFHELSEGEAFDDNLLLIGLAGVMGYSLFLLLPSIETFDTQGIPALLFLIKSGCEIIQSLIQVLFIVEASRRRASRVEQFLKKPGRSLVTFLIVINLAMWVVNTFEVKRAESHPIHINYYSELPWSVISRIFLPLIIFFRFHSTVCLSEIWAGAYKYYKQ